MSVEQNSLIKRVAREEATVEEIRGDLAQRCLQIPFRAWLHCQPSFFLFLDHGLFSPALPEGKHSVSHDGNKRPLRFGELHHVLYRTGAIVEFLVHIDESSGQREHHYEFLREVDYRLYRKYYPKALEQIDNLRQRAEDFLAREEL